MHTPRVTCLAAAVLALAAPSAWCEPAAAPIELLDASWDCTSIARVRQAPASAWHSLSSTSQLSPRSDVLWLRVGLATTEPAADAGWTLSMPSNRASSLSSYEASAYQQERIDAADPRAWQLCFRHLGRELRPRVVAPSYLCFAGARLGVEELELLPTPVFRARDLAATQWRAAAFGMILAMSLFSGLFYVALSERVFLKYLGYLLESVVLAFGLADRTLGYRHELDRATELADRDPLSGLLNRRALMTRTRALDAQGERRGGALALVLFDIDHFKRINDERGHAAWDACIRGFAEHLSAEMRRSDLAARYGAEFLAVLPGASRGAAMALAERVRVRVERDGALADGARVPISKRFSLGPTARCTLPRTPDAIG